MSFASDVRGELARVPVGEPCCACSELTAALLCGGGIAWRGRNRYAVTITSAEAPTVRRYFGMVKQFWGVVGQIRTITGDGLNNQTRYQLAMPEEEAAGLLDKLGLLDESALFGVRQLPLEETVRFACCRKSFLRAAFLMCGAASNPEKDAHIEFSAPTEGLTAPFPWSRRNLRRWSAISILWRRRSAAASIISRRSRRRSGAGPDLCLS